MKRYPIRVAKYAAYLVVLFFVIYVMLMAFGSAAPMEVLWSTSQGYMMIGAVVVFALMYPFFGFTKKRLTFNAAERVEDVERIMGLCGFERVEADIHGSDDMVFAATTTSKRLLMMYEDRIEITTVDGLSSIEGNRKEVVRAAFRMGTYIG